MSNLSADVQETTHELGSVEIRTDARLAAAVGGVASIVSIAYLARAIGDGGWLEWALVLVTGAIAAAHLQSLVDARVPLLVVDEHGVRLRSGRTWHGLPWREIECVEHEPRHGLLRDGRVTLVPVDEDAEVRSVRLSLATRVVGADGDLTAALEDLAGEPGRVVEIVAEHDEAADEYADEYDEHHEHEDQSWEQEQDGDASEHPVLHDPRPTLARGIGFLADRLTLRHRADEPVLESEHDEPEPTQALPIVASATPLPLREPVTGTRAEVRFDGAAAYALDHADAEAEIRPELPEASELRWSADEDLLVQPVADPVIGSELAAARVRLNLTVDQLAERTRIRPHVIESIEADDFAPCGGDFYARGHLRTLARVVGVDAAPLLASYDELYADAPIDARRVFEAELATHADGPIRGTRGGPNWSVLVAAVMAVVLAWSIARLIMDSPIQLDERPVLNGSPSSPAKLGPPVPVLLDASTGGAHVVVHDGTGQVVFNGDLAYGDTRTIKATPPVQVQSSDGSLGVTIDGKDQGPLGTEGQPASNTFAGPE
ncbi:helix-turn-helix domain-containing protein [Nocardioides sp. SR21]|uniref:helix-turn-helix domain-containing protein n=1 Tax=Nocardioides sp. SR21 TaxID=2919501 RepID=UPI001FAA29AC|nr:helix-turn-helix domain-containing protein [Nocardioides sp. SR21]